MIATLKHAAKKGLTVFRLRLVRLPPSTSPDLPLSVSLEFENVLPVATFAPWNADAEFLKAFQIIRGNTLVDIYRCWELWTLVEQTAKLEGGILEVGVWRGGTGALLAKQAALHGIQDPVYLCDTFKGVTKAGPNDTSYKGGEHADTTLGIVEDLLGRFHLTNVKILAGIFPDQTAHQIGPGERFRLCHIDVDVYQSAKDVLEWVWDRLVPGGIVVYDDYGFMACDGIRKQVNDQRTAKDRIVLHNLNGHALIVKLPVA